MQHAASAKAASNINERGHAGVSQPIMRPPRATGRYAAVGRSVTEVHLHGRPVDGPLAIRAASPEMKGPSRSFAEIRAPMDQ